MAKVKNLAGILEKAEAAAAHKRVGAAAAKVKIKKINNLNISVMVGDAKDILESIYPHNRSKAIREALKLADQRGELQDYKG